MEADEFDVEVRKKISANPGWFEQTERPLDPRQIASEMRRLGVAVPAQFLHFATHFGAGYFGTINVSSLDRKSPWYRWDKHVVLSNDSSLVVASDDETGGVYGFLCEDKKCGREVYYVNLETNRPEATPIADSFFDFVLMTAFDFDRRSSFP